MAGAQAAPICAPREEGQVAKTRTGAFPIGFRSWGNGWQKDLNDTIAFARASGFEGIDIAPLDASELKRIREGGLRIGSVDLARMTDLMSADAGKRKAAVQDNLRYIRSAVPLGARSFFTVAIPEDVNAKRGENFARAVDGYGQLCEAIAPLGAHVVFEGWPGPANSSLACTPADYRALLKEIPHGSGINFDPSHLIRMGIDPVRFLDEFGQKVFHVHGKDTEILGEGLYEHGNLQDATFEKPHGFGGHSWRYTIPGHGCARWGKLLGQLKAAGYDGLISIELEDENFNGTEEGEKRGLTAARAFLESI
jgi:sugar phosphate isomerase/epimerase